MTALRAVVMAFVVSMLLSACDVATVEETLADIMGGAPAAAVERDDADASDVDPPFASPTAADYAAAQAAEASKSPKTPSADGGPAARLSKPSTLPATARDAAADPAPASPDAAESATPALPGAADDSAAPASSAPSDAKSADADRPAKSEKPAPRPVDSASKPESAGGSSGDGDASAQAAVEQQVYELLSAERQRAGLKPLRLDSGLADGARGWSKRMATENFFSHDSSGNFAENIAYGYPTAQAVHDGWMSSQGHHANRMNPDHTVYGIGVYKRGDTFYYTERFR